MKKIQDFFATWAVILFLNQLFIFHGCFAPHCLLAALPHTGIIAFLLIRFLSNADDKVTKSEPKRETIIKPARKEKKETADFTTMSELDEIIHFDFKGEKYIKYIGKKLEGKGDVVIYDRFIEWPHEKGIDLMSISVSTKRINLVLCEDWNPYDFAQLETFYNKLANYSVSEMRKEIQSIHEHLQIPLKYDVIQDTLETMQNEQFKIHKTLYLNTDEIVNQSNEKEFKKLKDNIFRYKDMKIVLKKLK